MCVENREWVAIHTNIQIIIIVEVNALMFFKINSHSAVVLLNLSTKKRKTDFF